MLPENTVAAFATLCGATVVMTEADNPAHPQLTRAWRCLGCGADDVPDTPERTRRAANDHAFGCRSIPLPA